MTIPMMAAAAPPPVAPSQTIALLAMIFGLVAIIPFVGALSGLAALILGCISLAGRRGGKGMAITGVIAGLLLGTAGTIGGVYFMLRVRDAVFREPVAAVAAQYMHFVCTAESCQHEFAKSFEELNRERPAVMAEEMEGGTIRLKCPKCNAERSCLPMVACPKCKKHFLLESTKMLAEMQDDVGDQRPDLSKAKDVCPHCGQDRIEWYREQYRKKKKKKKG